MKLTKTAVYVLLLVILACILRFAAASFVDIGSDEMIYTLIPLHILSTGRLSTVEQAPLYFYLTDFVYKLVGGLSLVSGRLLSVFFGSLAVAVVFLIAGELFADKKVALLSAIFAALSGFIIKYSQEMDMPAFFFALLSLFFFLRFLKSNFQQSSLLYASALFFSLAVLIKPIILLIAPAYFIAFILQREKSESKTENENKTGSEDRPKIENPKSKKKMLQLTVLSLFLFLVVVSPVLVYNYLLYKEKGMTDYYFSTLAGIGTNALYQGQEGTAWSPSILWNVSKGHFMTMLHIDTVVLLFGILGLFFFWKENKNKKNRNYSLLFLSSMLFLPLYLAGKTASPSHYLWIPLILSIFSGYGIFTAYEKIILRFKKQVSFKTVVGVLSLASLVSSLYLLHTLAPLHEQSIAIALRGYAAEHLPPDAIVVLDPRIYRGIYAWAFNDRHYLEGTYFPELVKNIPSFPGASENIPLYYIECGPGTYCGWKPEDFQRIYNFGQQLTSAFQQQAEKVAEIKAIDTFIVYRGTLTVPRSVYETIDRTHLHWYTPVGWKYPELAVDNYTPKNFFDKFLNSFALVILYLNLAIALLSPLLVVALLLQQSGSEYQAHSNS